jgi:hypothetical protein
MDWLLKELSKTEHPTSCPHGRPIALRYSWKEIQRAFQTNLDSAGGWPPTPKGEDLPGKNARPSALSASSKPGFSPDPLRRTDFTGIWVSGLQRERFSLEMRFIFDSRAVGSSARRKDAPKRTRGNHD